MICGICFYKGERNAFNVRDTLFEHNRCMYGSEPSNVFKEIDFPITHGSRIWF